LLRSGLDSPPIGRHLYLHPVAALASRYATPIEPWSGSPQTVLSEHFAHLKDGYGVRIEAAPAHPGMLALATPWEGGRAHKEAMRAAAYQAVTIVLVRDTGEGRVTLDRHGEPVLDYWPSARDRYRLMRGMHEAARIACAAGAVRVSTLHTPPITLESEGGRPGAVTETRLQALGAEILRRGVVPNRVTLFSAHQMGTCRLGANRRQAVADPYGQVYGVTGLYVGDGSGFPTASGVNPMLSIMALAERVAGRIAAEM
jgi:choline dehydrogenase-like flavoprotein